jgi:DNA-3-methyladenine glycosylase I
VWTAPSKWPNKKGALMSSVKLNRIEQKSRVELPRCPWAKGDLSIQYHDEEWGSPVHDDRTFFEFLTLEGAQAGLSWDTILKKRERYRQVFDNFQAEVIANYGHRKISQLMNEEGIVRNRLKIQSVIQNAQSFLAVQKEFGSFDSYVWHFVGGHTKTNKWKTPKDVPARTAESDALSIDLKRRKFKFVGSTICYAFMQATGLVDDHLVSCFRYLQLRSSKIH